MALSIPGEQFQIMLSNTDSNGEFLFHFVTPTKQSEPYLSAYKSDASIHFEVEKKFLNQHPNFIYEIPLLDSGQIAEIIARSVRVQINNAYSGSDSTIAHAFNYLPQLTTWNFEYDLDDYVRFPKLKDYFEEYILRASVRDGAIKVTNSSKIEDQLVLLDGVPVNAKAVLSINPYLIKEISIYAGDIMLGSSLVKGIISLKTYEGLLADYKPKGSQTIALIGLSVPTENSTLNLPPKEKTMPDQRDQLLWIPQFNNEKEEFTVHFTSSDVIGDFILSIDGFSNDGKAVSFDQEININ